MKKYIVTIILALAFAPIFSAVQARELTTKEVVEQTRKKVKADKRGKAEAKKKAAEGWIVIEGTSPMELQMANQIAYEEATDQESMPYFYAGPGTFTSNNKSAALRYATKDAIQKIAEQIETNVASRSEFEDQTVGHGEYGGTTINNRTTAGDKISNRIAGIRPIVQIYRKKGNLYEVNVVMFYSRAKAEQLQSEVAGKAYEGNPELRDDVRSLLDGE